jgi:hypothetical protein
MIYVTAWLTMVLSSAYELRSITGL